MANVCHRPLTAALAGEAFQMINVVSRFHDHLESGDEFGAGRAVSGRAEQPANIPHINRRLARSKASAHASATLLRLLHTQSHE